MPASRAACLARRGISMPMISSAGETMRALMPRISGWFSVATLMVSATFTLLSAMMSGSVASPVWQMVTNGLTAVAQLGRMFRQRPAVAEPCYMRVVHLLTTIVVAMLALAACSTSRTETMPAHGAPAADGPPVLYKNLGRHSYTITTASSDAQRWFDQGLRLVYAFNHQEAQRAFREAARLDPGCAMCYWGIAITEGSNYNSPTDAGR